MNCLNRNGLILVLVLLGLAIATPLQAAGTPWTYNFDEKAAQLSRPMYKTHSAISNRPDGLVESVEFSGSQRRYVDLRYGEASSIRVALVIDELSRSDFDLFVDLNRDRKITMDEKIDGAGRIRNFALAMPRPQDGYDAKSAMRQIQFRRSRNGKSVSIATLGFFEGQVEVDGVNSTARRIDANGNGLFSDRIDQIWLDLNNDKKWDAFSERFAVSPTLILSGRRFSVLADKTGEKLSIRYVDKFGRLRLRSPLKSKNAALMDIEATLTGQDGSVFTITNLDDAIEVPIGKYNLDTLRLTVDYNLEPWTFVFSKMGAERSPTLYSVEANEEVSIDPVGDLDFSCKTDVKAAMPGGTISVSPRLHTSTGLLINTCTNRVDQFSRNNFDRTASIRLQHNGQTISSSSSGFA